MQRLKDKIFTERTGFIIAIFSVSIVVISTIIFLCFGSWDFSLTLDESKIGQFGDFVGGVAGSLIALVAVILYYVALREQQKDIKTNQETFELQIKSLNQQMTEFENQRIELEATRKIYEQQTKTMRNQQFDSNFYSLLNVFIQNKDSLNKDGNNYFIEVLNQISEHTRFEENDTIIVLYSKTLNSYLECYIKNRAALSMYFITLYRLLKMVDDCDHFTEEQKEFYSKVLRSQITKDELLILYYNYHSVFGKEIQPLILKYNFLKHLETLSKLEFANKFVINNNNQFQIISFIDALGNLLLRNISLAKSIENTEPIKIEEIHKESGIIMGLYIDDDVEVKMFLDNSDSKIFDLCRNDFKNLVEFFLYDELYLNKFKLPSQDDIEVSTTSKADQIIYNYKIAY